MHTVVGFAEMGGRDDFRTSTLAKLMVKHKVCDNLLNVRLRLARWLATTQLDWLAKVVRMPVRPVSSHFRSKSPAGRKNQTATSKAGLHSAATGASNVPRHSFVQPLYFFRNALGPLRNRFASQMSQTSCATPSRIGIRAFQTYTAYRRTLTRSKEGHT